MTPDELRALADTLRRIVPRPEQDHLDAGDALERAADYLRAQADAEPVAKITKSGSGSIAMFATDGGPFDMSKYIGAALFTQPAPATAQIEKEKANGSR